MGSGGRSHPIRPSTAPSGLSWLTALPTIPLGSGVPPSPPVQPHRDQRHRSPPSQLQTRRKRAATGMWGALGEPPSTGLPQPAMEPPRTFFHPGTMTKIPRGPQRPPSLPGGAQRRVGHFTAGKLRQRRVKRPVSHGPGWAEAARPRLPAPPVPRPAAGPGGRRCPQHREPRRGRGRGRRWEPGPWARGMPRLFWGDAVSPGGCPGVGGDTAVGSGLSPPHSSRQRSPEPQRSSPGIFGEGNGVQPVQPLAGLGTTGRVSVPRGGGRAGNWSGGTQRGVPGAPGLGGQRTRRGGEQGLAGAGAGGGTAAAASQPSVRAAASPGPSRGSRRGSPRPAAPGVRTGLAAARSRRVRPHRRGAGAASRGDPEGPARLPRDGAPTGPGEQEWPGPSPAAGSSLRPPAQLHPRPR